MQGFAYITINIFKQRTLNRTMALKINNHSTLFAFFFFVSSFGYAQINAIAIYTHQQVKIDYEKDYQLVISNQLSNFQFHQEYTEFTTPQGWEFTYIKNYYDWFYDAVQKKIIEQRVLKNGTKVIANWPADLTWKITEETKVIAGYKVQKAVTQSHDLTGRPSEWDYGDAIAWFTTEIPISSGPARYYGLSGLIVYLEFTGRPYTYILKDIKWDTNETITIPTEGIKVTKEQTLRYFELITNKWIKEQKNRLKKSSF